MFLNIVKQFLDSDLVPHALFFGLPACLPTVVLNFLPGMKALRCLNGQCLLQGLQSQAEKYFWIAQPLWIITIIIPKCSSASELSFLNQACTTPDSRTLYDGLLRQPPCFAILGQKQQREVYGAPDKSPDKAGTLWFSLLGHNLCRPSWEKHVVNITMLKNRRFQFKFWVFLTLQFTRYKLLKREDKGMSHRVQS